MKIILNVLLINLFIVLIGYFQRENILYFINKQNVEKISKYLIKNKIKNYIVANINGDGSEILINDLPKEIINQYSSIIKTTHFLVGSDARIYCTFYKKNDNLMFEVKTYKMWHNSFLYFGDIIYEYRINTNAINLSHPVK